MAIQEMISPEDAQALVVGAVSLLPTEVVPLLDACGRVAAADLVSDIDVSPFDHTAMDGFALRAAQLEGASVDTPVRLRVVAEEGAGSVYSGPIGADECVRIMTGAPMPAGTDSVVKYEIVGVVEGDGKTGSLVEFSALTSVGSNVRAAGEEAHAGEVVVHAGEVIAAAGVGFLAGCGVVEVPTYKRPRVAIMATGSELVPPTEVPTPGKIRNSNGHALAALVLQAGGVPAMLPIVPDTFDALRDAVAAAAAEYDFVITTGGAANGDYDFIKQVIDDLGDLRMTTVNMRPGKAQAFGLVSGTPVFGLPGNPAAAFTGFHMLIRPALRKMQGYCHFNHTTVWARLSRDVKKKDPRRIYLRSTLEKDADGYAVTPAKNQSSGLFGPVQRSNCLVIMPEGLDSKTAGDLVECLLLDIPEELVL